MLKVLNSWGMHRLANNNENVGRVKKLAFENRNHCLWSGVTGRGYHLLAITLPPSSPIKGKDKFGKCEENPPLCILRLVHLNVPHGQTTNQHNWFDRLPASAGKMVDEYDVKGGIQGHWCFDHGNATAHCALSVPDFRVENKMTGALHSRPSLHSAPCDSFISPKLKLELNGRKYNDMPMIEAKSHDAFAEFRTMRFKKCYEMWCDLRARSVKSQGNILWRRKI